MKTLAFPTRFNVIARHHPLAQHLKLTLFFLFFLYQSVSAQNVLSYHPLAKALALGKSFDLFNPSSAYASDIFSSFNTIQTGQSSRQVYMSVVDSRESYNKTMHVDASMEASFLSIFHANGNYANTGSEFFSASSMTICIIGAAEYGDFRVSNPVLSANAQQLAHDPVAFKQQYGEFYVSSVKKAQYLYVFITLTNLTQSIKQQMSAELGAGGGFAIFSADLQGKVNKVVEQFRNSHSVQLKVQSFGKNNLRDLPLADITSDFFANGTFSSNTYNAMIRYIDQNFSEPNGSEIEYSYSPLSQFGYRNDLYFDKVNRKFDKYIDLCKEMMQYNNLQNEVNQATSCTGFSLVTGADRTLLNKDKSDIKQRIDDLTDAMASCRQNDCGTMSSCCNIDDIATPIDNSQLDQLRNRYLSPLDELASFQLTGPYRMDFQPNPNGGGSYINIFDKQGTAYSGLNITTTNQNKYTIQSALDFINGIPGRATYTITTWVNGVPMGSTSIQVEGNAIGHYFFNSEPIPVGQKFNGRLPEHVGISIVLTGYFPGPNMNGLYISVLPYSRLLFNF